jgi:hypothetical protein
MSRSDLSPEANAELIALDAILTGEPVGEEHLELAALVDSVRRTSPALDAAGRARIEERIGRLRSPRRARSRQAPSPRRLALAGGPLVALLVAVAVVVGTGALNGSKPVVSNSLGSGIALPRALHPAAATPATGQKVGGAGLHGTATGTNVGPTGATSALGTAVSRAPGASANASAPPGSTNFSADNLNPHDRLVARGASLTLASSPDQMQTVAGEVVSNTERLGGIVESSNVNVHGPSSYASFSLSVPSTRLGQLIASLSSLTAVRSLDQSANDITDSYDQASAQLSDEKAQRAALIKALAAAFTLSAEQTIQQKINHLDNEIAAATHHVGALLTRGHNATVSVQIVPGAAGAAGGGGPVNRALGDALRVLDVALAIALVALAIVLPIGLVALLLFWSTSTLRQRSRERALAATASS